MKFRNPWIDPRIEQARPEHAQAYLTQHGWKLLGPAENPGLLRYERQDGDADSPTLFVPVRVKDGASLQWMIDLVADLAQFEDRWAVEVLGDILRAAPEVGTANGAGLSANTEIAQR